jgi:hypothetical protein
VVVVVEVPDAAAAEIRPSEATVAMIIFFIAVSCLG